MQMGKGNELYWCHRQIQVLPVKTWYRHSFIQKRPVKITGRLFEMVYSLNAFNCQSHAHAATDTQGRQAFFGIATLHFV